MSQTVPEFDGRIKNRLRALRHAHGLSQEHVAEACGVHEATVDRWERGSSCPDRQKVRLARLFGCSVHHIWLFETAVTDATTAAVLAGATGASQ